MGKTYSTIDTLTAEGLFNITVDIGDVSRIQNVLGIAIERLSNSPVTKEQLEYIGATSVDYAKQLITIQGAIDTRKAHDSIHWRMPSENRLEIYDDATSWNNYPYPASIEYGFHPFGSSKYVPPRPFLRPAIKYAQLLTKYTIQDSIQQMFQGNNWTTIGFFSNTQQRPIPFEIGSKINMSKIRTGDKKGQFPSRAGARAMSGIRGRNYLRTASGRPKKLSSGQHRYIGFASHRSRTSVDKFSQIKGYQPGAYSRNYFGIKKSNKSD